jgi:hypothetical protein
MRSIAELVEAQPGISWLDLPQVATKMIELPWSLKHSVSGIALEQGSYICKSLYILPLTGPFEPSKELLDRFSTRVCPGCLDDLRSSLLIEYARAGCAPPSLYSQNCTSTSTQELNQLNLALPSSFAWSIRPGSLRVLVRSVSDNDR